MKKCIRGMLVIMLFAWGCTANLMLTNMRVDRSIRPAKTGKIAVISSINYWSGNQGVFGRDDDAQVAKMKETIAYIVYNTGLFDDVMYTKEGVKSIQNEKGKKILYLDAVVYTTEIGAFNWWVSWCAVYPMPAYWPIQRKTGTVSVNIEITVSDEARTLATINSFGAHEYTITFYGFFRTAPIERAAEKAFMEAGANLKTNLSKIDSYIAKGQAVSTKNTVGSIYDIKSADEIIIKHATNQPLRMGELIFAEKKGSAIKMIVHFPMLSISKCRLVKSADYLNLEKNMEVYRN